MNILSVSPSLRILNNFSLKNTSPFLRFNYLQNDLVSFSSSSKDMPMWDDFISKISMVYPNQKPEQVVLDAVLKEENKIGEGVKKIVYSIDGVDDYVVALFKKRQASDENSLVGVKDAFPDYNFGQEVATNNANIIVMKKIEGDVHSISDWTAKYQGLVYRNEPITKQDAELFLSKLQQLEKLPLESYIDFARQIRYLTDRRIKIDLFNPNNVIVDVKNKKITHFDLFENPSIFHWLGTEVNGVQDMINILSDALLQGEYLKALDEKDSECLIKTTKSIANKCEIAGKIVGLSSDRSIAYRTYEYLQNKLRQKDGRNTKYLELYKNFQEVYGV